MERSCRIEVSVLVLTYNQENTVKRALESIISQETDINYEIIISDDDSKDDTYSICSGYSKTNKSIKLLDKHPNFGVVKNYFYALQYAKGKLIMGCAGDDWWHNNNKIQIQVEFMKKHPGVSLCYGNVLFYNTITNSISPGKHVKEKISLDDLIVYNPIAAVTLCYRKECLPQSLLEEIVLNNFQMEDYPIILTAAHYGEIAGIDEALATYSVSPNSISNCSSLIYKELFEERVKSIRLYYAEKFGRLKELSTKVNDCYMLSLAINGIRYNNKNYCKKHLKGIVNKRPSDYAKLFLCYIPGGFLYLRHLMKNIIVE